MGKVDSVPRVVSCTRVRGKMENEMGTAEK